MRRHPLTGCRADELFGIWMIDPKVHEDLVNFALTQLDNLGANLQEKEAEKEQEKPYSVHGPVAVYELDGAITKHPDSFGMGASTLRAQQALRQIVNEEKGIDRILMHIDSPGGTNLGLDELSKYMQKLDRRIPVYVHGSDRLTSAAYWLGSAGRELTATPNTWVGGIGSYVLLTDDSGRWEKAGIKRHVISSHENKGLGADGKITDKVLAKAQEQVNQLTDLFVQRVAEHRKLPVEQVRNLATGDSWLATAAKEKGLIDKVTTFEDRLEELQGKSAPYAFRGTYGQPRAIAASDKRSRQMLTAQQIAQLRNLPGAASVTEEQADVWLLNFAQEAQNARQQQATEISNLRTQISQLQSSATSQQMTAEYLNGMAELAAQRVDFLGVQGKLLGGQATMLKGFLYPQEGKPDAAMFAKLQNGSTVFDSILKVMENNTPNGLVKEKSGGQPAPKSEPGNDDSAMKINLDSLNKTRMDNGLAPITKEDLQKQGFKVA